MKYSTLGAFEKHLQSAAPDHFSDIYLLLAKDAFVRRQAVDKLSALILKNQVATGLNLYAFDAEKQSIHTVMQELEMLAFFVKKRLVIVHNADAFDKAATTKLENYFASPNHTVCLVLSAETLNRSTNFYKKAEKVGVVLDIPEEKPWEREKNVAEWLRTEAIAQKKQMSSTTCQTMVKQLGTDQTLLHGELQKLVCYVGDRPTIEEKDIAAICTTVNLDNAWQLGEAIFNRHAAIALRITKGLLADGTALIALLRQIRSQFQTEYQVCTILAQGGTPADISQEFPYMRGSILDRHVKQAQTYGMNNFKKGLLAIDEAELQAKNSSVDPEFLADMLIVKLTTK